MEKMQGDERRKYILSLLRNMNRPITGQELAEKTGVSRQVIVTDIALLRTSEQPIIATNRGYLLQKAREDKNSFKRVIVCRHKPEETKEELEAIVDCGVTIIDVIVEHPFYGDLAGSLMISSRYDVSRFLEAIAKNEAALISELTDGVHLHTLVADEEAKIDEACRRLEALSILVTENS